MARFTDRMGTEVGNFFDEELPDECRVALLSLIRHDWTPGKNRGILVNCLKRFGGALIVGELMLNEEKTHPVPAPLLRRGIPRQVHKKFRYQPGGGCPSQA